MALTDWFKKRKKTVPETVASNLETLEEYKARWRSIYIMFFTMFLMSLGFSIILTNVWPYLDKLDPQAGKEFMGIVVAANPLGQMIFSPLVGWWSNKMKTTHIPLLTTVAIFIIGSGWYSILEAFTENRKYHMFFARFFTGVSASSTAVCRSYLSAASTKKERTWAVSLVSFAQVLGFIVGPAFQAAVTPLGDKGYVFFNGYLHIDMYTAPGWVNVLLGILNFVFFLPCIFKEQKIAAREAMVKQNAESEEATWKGIKPDYVSSWTLIISFFIIGFNFVLLETLATPLTMDQFGWSKKEALFYMGILMTVGGILATFSFACINPLCRFFEENQVMVWGGFMFMVLARIICIPFGGPIPPIAGLSEDGNLTLSLNVTSNSTEPEELLGCPASQEWCLYTPAMTLWQFIIGYAFTAMAYPIGITLIQSIFSKVLGPRPQGVWMGLLTMAGCLSRVMGPIFISLIYTKYGTIWTFALTAAMMVVATIWLFFMDKRLRTVIEQYGQYAKKDAALDPNEAIQLVENNKDKNHVDS